MHSAAAGEKRNAARIAALEAEEFVTKSELDKRLEEYLLRSEAKDWFGLFEEKMSSMMSAIQEVNVNQKNTDSELTVLRQNADETRENLAVMGKHLKASDERANAADSNIAALERTTDTSVADLKDRARLAENSAQDNERAILNLKQALSDMEAKVSFLESAAEKESNKFSKYDEMMAAVDQSVMQSEARFSELEKFMEVEPRT